jgi:hypothetical protein
MLKYSNMKESAWVISVNMGYGHQRTSYPLKNLAPQGRVINANDYQGIPGKDKKIWETTRRGYEFISNFYQIPLVGGAIFSFFDRFQRILTFYPKRDLSEPNFVLKQIYSGLKKRWGEHLIKSLKIKNPKLPIISTFFTPAFMAEFFNYPGDIFCVVCDADISRTWASLNPKESKIKYFAPNERTAERLKLYGVKSENIFLTGYPLPLENIGAEKMEILKEDLKERILNLDTKRKYFEKYKDLIESRLGKLPEKSSRPLTIMFSIGGAGAQKEIAIKIVKYLKSYLNQGQLRIILSAGIREKVREYFETELNKLGLKQSEFVEVIYEKNIGDYFQRFNQALRETDILWTKPSELSFYSALGIPIIVAPPIGSQEEFNMRWLLKSGFGILQENLNHVSEWLFDWLDQGYLAEMAVEGFIEGEKLGTFNIRKICSG